MIYSASLVGHGNSKIFNLQSGYYSEGSYYEFLVMLFRVIDTQYSEFVIIIGSSLFNCD